MLLARPAAGSLLPVKPEPVKSEPPAAGSPRGRVGPDRPVVPPVLALLPVQRVDGVLVLGA